MKKEPKMFSSANIYSETHDMCRKLAAASDESIASIIAIAVENYYNEKKGGKSGSN